MLRCFLTINLFLVSFIISGQNTGSFPYSLNRSDYVILPTAIGFRVAAYLLEDYPDMSPEDIAALDKNEINGFDRSATLNWNPGLDRASDIGIAAMMAVPPVYMLLSKKNNDWKNITTVGLMYVETVAATWGFQEFIKSMAQRKRPYLYNEELSIEERAGFVEENKAFDSFYSGHTAMAFSTAVFLSKTCTDIYGRSVFSALTWTVSLTAASAIGFIRYQSGQHFPTDILAGAVVGSAIGYLVPVLHKSKSHTDKITWMVVPGGMYVACRL